MSSLSGQPLPFVDTSLRLTTTTTTTATTTTTTTTLPPHHDHRSEDGEQAIENLIATFARAPNQGDTPAVHTDTGVSGDASTSRVYFSYPNRAIQIVLYRPNNRSGMATIDITEQYALRPGTVGQAQTQR